MKPLSDEAVSKILLSLAGWEITGWRGPVRDHHGDTISSELITWTVDQFVDDHGYINLYIPANFSLAWLIFNWAWEYSDAPLIEGCFSISYLVQDWWLMMRKEVAYLPKQHPQDIQRIILDTIFSFAVEAKMVEE